MTVTFDYDVDEIQTVGEGLTRSGALCQEM